GADGTLQIIRQMQGFEAGASSWEPDIFARRIVDYKPENLDDLCLSGEVAWARLALHPALADAARRVRPTRIAPISFFLREDADWLLDESHITPEGLSHAGRAVREALEERGASFFNDLVRATHRLPSEVEDALWELAAGGLVTADGFENLRAIMDTRHKRGRRAAGRWSLVARAASPLSREERIKRHATQLLLRYGVLFRDLLADEPIAPPWRELLVVLRRMEAQGEIRGGRFVSGLTGEQYARPEAVDLLRAVRRSREAA
ncbi:MAG TPA: DEAD/DEAH box helicase, partial [Bryobacteraceae bacterium]|nr:DEAD/DEAH box helicase [Bryobacteraceae bacterium]